MSFASSGFEADGGTTSNFGAISMSGNLTIAGSIASIDALIKLILYFVHERAWAKALKLLKTKRGKKRKQSTA